MIQRAQVLATLQQALQAWPDADCAWEGGSAAFGSQDELSDIDAVAVVADDAIDRSFTHIEAALHALSPVVLRLDVPATSGYSQKFYRLRDAGEFLVADVVLIRRSEPLLFREVELHGRGQTWLDRRGILAETHLDMAGDLDKARARVQPLNAAFHMFQHIVTKERLRGRAVEALSFYQAMTMRPLIEALRLLHAPHTRVFGPRYLARDLADLGTKHGEARAWFERCMARLQAQGPGGGLEGLT